MNISKLKAKLVTKVGEIARGFSETKYFGLRNKYYKTKNSFMKNIYKFRILKIEAKQGAYIGLPEKKDMLTSQPILPHGLLSIFISGLTVIGKNCIIHEQTVMGISKGKSPTIGDNCFIGAGAKIIGGVTIGNNCRIGAGCVVVDDVPDNTTVVSQKPRYITKSEDYKLDLEYNVTGKRSENDK